MSEDLLSRLKREMQPKIEGIRSYVYLVWSKPKPKFVNEDLLEDINVLGWYTKGLGERDVFVGVDMDNGRRSSIDIYPDRLRLYTRAGDCPGAVLSLFKRIQHHYDPGARLLNCRGELITK